MNRSCEFPIFYSTCVFFFFFFISSLCSLHNFRFKLFNFILTLRIKKKISLHDISNVTQFSCGSMLNHVRSFLILDSKVFIQFKISIGCDTIRIKWELDYIRYNVNSFLWIVFFPERIISKTKLNSIIDSQSINISFRNIREINRALFKVTTNVRTHKGNFNPDQVFDCVMYSLNHFCRDYIRRRDSSVSKQTFSKIHFINVKLSSRNRSCK